MKAAAVLAGGISRHAFAHAPECESLCTDGADCNCGAVVPRIRRHPRPVIVAAEPQWSPYAQGGDS